MLSLPEIKKLAEKIVIEWNESYDEDNGEFCGRHIDEILEDNKYDYLSDDDWWLVHDLAEGLLDKKMGY